MYRVVITFSLDAQSLKGDYTMLVSFATLPVQLSLSDGLVPKLSIPSVYGDLIYVVWGTPRRQ